MSLFLVVKSQRRVHFLFDVQTKYSTMMLPMLSFTIIFTHKMTFGIRKLSQWRTRSFSLVCFLIVRCLFHCEDICLIVRCHFVYSNEISKLYSSMRCVIRSEIGSPSRVRSLDFRSMDFEYCILHTRN